MIFQVLSSATNGESPHEMTGTRRPNNRSLRWRRRRSRFRGGRLVLWRRNAGILQRLVERESYIIRRHSSIKFQSIYKHRRSGVHSNHVSFAHGGTHALFILSLDASLQLRYVEIVLLSLQSGPFVEFRVLAVAALLSADGMLIAVQVIGIVPVGITVLRGQAIGVHCRVHRPRVNLFERVILVNEKNA